MQHSYSPRGGVASVSLIHFLLQENNKSAHDMLAQGYCMPLNVRTALLNGEALWEVPNDKTLIITMVESP